MEFARRHACLAGCLFVAFAATVLILTQAPVFRLAELHIGRFNDQVGYVTTARWFADTGELRSHLIYPAYLEHPNWRLYMPGHYFALAAAFKLFGYGAVVARLPGLVSFVASAVGVFLIGRKLYGHTSGLFAALLFLAFPPNLAYAFTALSEPTTIAAAVLTFCAVVHLPERFRYAAVPFLLVVPFLFRETGALLVLPIAALALRRPDGRIPALLLTVVGSVVSLGAVYFWQTATGRMSPPISWILDGELNVADAFREESRGAVPLGEWSAALWQNFSENAGRVAKSFVEDPTATLEPIFTAIVLAFVLVSLVSGRARRRDDLYPLGVGLMGIATFAVVMLIHKVYPHIAIRHTLFTFPFAAVAVAPLVKALVAGSVRKPHPESATVVHGRQGTFFEHGADESLWREDSVGDREEVFMLRNHGDVLLASRNVVPAMKLFVLSLPILWLSDRALAVVAGDITLDASPSVTRRLEEMKLDERLLVSTPSHGLDYVLKHYPVRWSFVPENEATLQLLDQEHDIGTLMLVKEDMGTRFSHRLLEGLGLRQDELFVNRFWAFRKGTGGGVTGGPVEGDGFRERFGEEQIRQILKETEEAVRVGVVLRKYDINMRQLDNWRRLYGSLTPERQIELLKQENVQLRAIAEEQGAALEAQKFFTRGEILAILQEYRADANAEDLARRYGIDEQTIRRWELAFEGADIEGAHAIERLEAENRRLRQLVAEQEAIGQGGSEVDRD